MKKKTTGTIWITDADGVKRPFRLRWDMHAISTFEELTGDNAFAGFKINVHNIRAALWAAIDAHAASNDEEAPVSFRKFGTLLIDEDEVARASEEVFKLIGVKLKNPADPQKAPTEEASPSPSSAATNSEPSTSDSPTENSGD